MRRLVLFLVLMATGSLTLAAQAGAAASTVTTNLSVPIDQLLLSTCANGGFGEIVEVSGTLHEVFHTTVDDAGGMHGTQKSNLQGLSGVGQVTGAKYQVTDGRVFEFNTKAGAEATVVSNFRLIGQGPDNNFVFHASSHVTVNANGTMTANHINLQTECR